MANAFYLAFPLLGRLGVLSQFTLLCPLCRTIAKLISSAQFCAFETLFFLVPYVSKLARITVNVREARSYFSHCLVDC